MNVLNVCVESGKKYSNVKINIERYPNVRRRNTITASLPLGAVKEEERK